MPKSTIFAVPSFGEDDVRRLYVAMDDLRLSVVGMLQPIAHLHQQFQLVHERHGAALGNDPRDRLAIQALHDEVGVPILLAALINGNDVFVLQACGCAQLAVEKLLQQRTLAVAGIRPLEHFDGYGSIQRSIVGAIDDAHPARPYDVYHDVLADLLYQRIRTFSQTALGYLRLT